MPLAAWTTGTWRLTEKGNGNGAKRSDRAVVLVSFQVDTDHGLAVNGSGVKPPSVRIEYRVRSTPYCIIRTRTRAYLYMLN